MSTSRLARHLATAAVAATLAVPASAAIVHWGDANLVIPATYAGLYINVEERTTSSDKSLAGWDINPYGSGDLRWYQPVGGGLLRIFDSVGPSSLPAGAMVDASGIFDEEAFCEFGPELYNWSTNASNYFGFSFAANDGLLHYGWGRMVIGAEATDRVLAELAYEGVAGEGIAVGAIPSPGALALLVCAGIGSKRRRR